MELKGNYLKKLLADYAAGRLNPGPGIHYVQILHNNKCPFLKDMDCDCEPEVRLMEPDA